MNGKAYIDSGYNAIDDSGIANYIYYYGNNSF